jgi:hypothetical protein
MHDPIRPPLAPNPIQLPSFSRGRQFLSLGLLSGLAALSVHADTLLPGGILRVEFQTRPPFIESNPNALSLALGNVTIGAPYSRITGTLYDGNRLLGEAWSTLGAGSTGPYSFHPLPTTWKSAGSPWDPFWFAPGLTPVVDFSTLWSGTIQGRIDVTIDSGSIVYDPSALYMRTTFATYSNGGSSIPPNPTITRITLIPPSGTPPPPVTPPPPLTPPPPPGAPPPRAPGHAAPRDTPTGDTPARHPAPGDAASSDTSRTRGRQ